jgi:hypothetical protein
MTEIMIDGIKAVTFHNGVVRVNCRSEWGGAPSRHPAHPRQCSRRAGANSRQQLAGASKADDSTGRSDCAHWTGGSELEAPLGPHSVIAGSPQRGMGRRWQSGIIERAKKFSRLVRARMDSGRRYGIGGTNFRYRDGGTWNFERLRRLPGIPRPVLRWDAR